MLLVTPPESGFPVPVFMCPSLFICLPMYSALSPKESSTLVSLMVLVDRPFVLYLLPFLITATKAWLCKNLSHWFSSVDFAILVITSGCKPLFLRLTTNFFFMSFQGVLRSGYFFNSLSMASIKALLSLISSALKRVGSKLVSNTLRTS